MVNVPVAFWPGWALILIGCGTPSVMSKAWAI